MDLEERRAHTRHLINKLIATSRAVRPDHPQTIPFENSAPSREDPLRNLDASVWQQLAVNELPDWIQKQMDQSILPMYEVAFEAVDLERSVAEITDFEPTLERRSDSGVWQMRTRFMSGPDVRSRAGVFFERLAELARMLDDRKFEVASVPRSEVIVHELRSRLPQLGIPVIGPGGRVTVYVSSKRIEADLVVRKRQSEIQSEWINPDEVIDRIIRRITDEIGVEGGVRAFAAFGYFELSKYERQALMRPAFAVIFENVRSEDLPAKWQSALAEPATWASEIPLHEGLGSWVE